MKICYALLEMSYILYGMNFYGNFDNSSCQIWKLPIFKVDKLESWQTWKLTKLKVDKIEYVLSKLKISKVDKIENF